MRLLALLGSAVTAAAVAGATTTTVPIYLQPVTHSTTQDIPPALLAEVSYERQPEPSSATGDARTTAAEVTNYEPPEIPEDAKLLRIGAYDAEKGEWTSSTSVMSVDNFRKGYSPHFIVTVDSSSSQSEEETGDVVLGIACRGVKVDAGYTRDFGPQAVVVRTAPGKQPELNRPVVLSPEGKKVVEEEKTFFQKYTLTPSP